MQKNFVIHIFHHLPMFSEAIANAVRELDGHRCFTFTPGSVDAFRPEHQDQSAACDLCLFDAQLHVETCNRYWKDRLARNPDCRSALLVSRSSQDVAAFGELAIHGCICEEETLLAFRTAIATILSGRTFCSSDLGHYFFRKLGCNTPSVPSVEKDFRFTQRETEILSLIAMEHLSNKELAKRLHVSVYTVKNHVHRILEKLGVESRRMAGELARRQNLLISTG